jgi:hypothetical protein
MEAREWYTVMTTGHHQDDDRMPLPTPVINYHRDSNGLRAINQIAEWGKTEGGAYVILGQSPSAMIETAFFLIKDPTKYYTDTSFRVAEDAPSE